MALPQKRLSLPEFLKWENSQSSRHELYRGEVFAMVGARRVHGLIAGNVFASLRALLKGGPCRAFAESMKVQTADDSLFYPDVFVTCDEADLRTDMVFRQPTVIVEVLSDSTQAYDRGLKFSAYRQIARLQEYVLIDPDTRRLEVFRRNERGNFELFDQSGTGFLVLASLNLSVAMAEVFDGVETPVQSAGVLPELGAGPDLL
jgi:Uma2 family endonuclease